MCFVAVNSKILSSKNEIKSGKQNLAISKAVLGQGFKFGGEVIVSDQCVVNLPLRLWFPELSKTPYMTGGK